MIGLFVCFLSFFFRLGGEVGDRLKGNKQLFWRNRVLFQKPCQILGQILLRCAILVLGVKFCEKSTLRSLFRVSLWHERNSRLGGVLKNCGHACLQFYIWLPPHRNVCIRCLKSYIFLKKRVFKGHWTSSISSLQLFPKKLGFLYH